MAVTDVLRGPPLATPRPLDRALRWWSAQPPRMRLVLCLILVGAMAFRCADSRAQLQSRWGGEGVVVWQASRTISAGQAVGGALTEVRLPPIAVPPAALEEAPAPGTVAVVPIFEGAVLVQAHVEAAGIADALDEDQRLVPVPIDPTWGVHPGAVVDVWALADPPALLAGHLAVQAVVGERSRQVAMVVVDAGEVSALTAAIVDDGVRLTVTAGDDTP